MASNDPAPPAGSPSPEPDPAGAGVGQVAKVEGGVAETPPVPAAAESATPGVAVAPEAAKAEAAKAEAAKVEPATAEAAKAEPAAAEAAKVEAAKVEPATAEAAPAEAAKVEPATSEAAKAEPAQAEAASPTPPPSVVAAVTATPAGAVELHLVGRTDVGQLREHNEDNFTLVRIDDDMRDPEVLLRHQLGARGTLLVVCDGMGGAAAGEVASSMAVATLPEIMRSDLTAPAPPGVVDDPEIALARKLRYASEEANRRIFTEQQHNLARSGMGTTMTAAYLRDDRAIIAQVGDSRGYVYRRGTLTQVTRDQSLVNQLLETGQITVEQAKYFEHSNVILQALGVQEDVEVQLSRVELKRGDRLMLCSDGLVGVVSDEEIRGVMGAADDPADAARILIELANGAGGPDNITVVVAHLGGEGLAEPTEADVIEYQTWRIDPEPPEPSPEALATEQRAEADHDEFPGDPEPAAAPPPRAGIQHVELFSMAAIVGLIVGAIVVGFSMYQRAVPCEVRAARAGLVVLADGRDSGARTVEGVVSLRLRPGRHHVGLGNPRRSPLGRLPGAQEIEVVEGQACVLSFEESAAAEAASSGESAR